MKDRTSEPMSPKKLMQEVRTGYLRLESFRSARLNFLKAYCGPYYDKTAATPGNNPLNLIFDAIRILVPTLVFNYPRHSVTTPYVADKQYADLLALALDQQDKQLNIRDTYRQVIVDALFTFGILKTGLAQSDSIYALDPDLKIDPGSIYTKTVSFENFVADPNSREHMFRDARFIGDRIAVPRSLLLESGLYDEDLVERLPRCYSQDRDHRAAKLSMHGIQEDALSEPEDLVEIIELWIPAANAIVTVPGDSAVSFDGYLRIADYYGVKEGPYTMLALTPPVPDNPLPIPTVGVWYDLAMRANEMCRKVIEQASRQKDIVAYRPSAADDAEQMRDAGDGQAVAVDDPESIRTISFGGQQQGNERQLTNLQSWFNQMAANPNQVGGRSVEAGSATAANILQQNASTALEDLKDMVYIMAADESRRRVFYIHTDPMIHAPLTHRQPVQSGIQPGPGGRPIYMPPTYQEVQVFLTPEMRSGDFIDFTVEIQPYSLGREDSSTRLKNKITFATQILPAVVTAAQAAMQLNIPFNATGLLIEMGKDLGMDDLSEILLDPQFQQQVVMQQLAGPQDQSGKTNPAQAPNPGLNGIMQNGQPGTVQGTPPSSQMEQRQGQQSGANESQRMMGLFDKRAFAPVTATGT